jgi:hypothetical protein
MEICSSEIVSLQGNIGMQLQFARSLIYQEVSMDSFVVGCRGRNRWKDFGNTENYRRHETWDAKVPR